MAPSKVGAHGQMMRQTTKFCPCCDEWHPLRAFWRDASKPTGYKSSCALHRLGRVRVGPIRAALEARMIEDELSWSDVALAGGFVNNGRPGTSQIKRRLGIEPHQGSVKKGKRYPEKYARTIDIGMAVRIIRAAGIAPVEVGL